MDQEETFHQVKDFHIQAIVRAGGIPLILPNIKTAAQIDQFATTLHGLYATGGDDINPAYFGEEPHQKLGTVTPLRDHFEMELTKAMLKLNKPFLGVCRGAQILNVAIGGTLFQD